MSRVGVIFRLAWRESRASRRRLLLFGSAISIGVATLVAVASLTVNLQDSVHRQARELLGADLVLTSNRPFTAPVEAMLDSLARQGIGVARRTELTSMGFVAKRAGTRLVDVRAVGGGMGPVQDELCASSPVVEPNGASALRCAATPLRRPRRSSQRPGSPDLR